jgi:hypothetical protein
LKLGADLNRVRQQVIERQDFEAAAASKSPEARRWPVANS